MVIENSCYLPFLRGSLIKISKLCFLSFRIDQETGSIQVSLLFFPGVTPEWEILAFVPGFLQSELMTILEFSFRSSRRGGRRNWTQESHFFLLDQGAFEQLVLLRGWPRIFKHGTCAPLFVISSVVGLKMGIIHIPDSSVLGKRSRKWKYNFAPHRLLQKWQKKQENTGLPCC